MATFLQTVLMTSFHGSIVILAVLLLRLVLRKAPKKFICLLWMLAGIRLLLPIPIESAYSLQPQSIGLHWQLPSALIALVLIFIYAEKCLMLLRFLAAGNLTESKLPLCLGLSNQKSISQRVCLGRRRNRFLPMSELIWRRAIIGSK